MLNGTAPTAGCLRLPSISIKKQLDRCLGQPVLVVSPPKESTTCRENVREATGLDSDDGEARRHRLDHSKPEAFELRRRKEDISGGKDHSHIRDPAQESHRTVQPHPVTSTFQTVPITPISRDQEQTTRGPSEDASGHIEEVIHAFRCDQTGDVHHDRPRRIDTQGCSGGEALFIARLGFEIYSEREGANRLSGQPVPVSDERGDSLGMGQNCEAEPFDEHALESGVQPTDPT